MRLFTRPVCLSLIAWNLAWIVLAAHGCALLGVG